MCERVLLGFVHGCAHVCLRLGMATAAPSVCARAETLSIN